MSFLSVDSIFLSLSLFLPLFHAHQRRCTLLVRGRVPSPRLRGLIVSPVDVFLLLVIFILHAAKSVASHTPPKSRRDSNKEKADPLPLCTGILTVFHLSLSRSVHPESSRGRAGRRGGLLAPEPRLRAVLVGERLGSEGVKGGGWAGGWSGRAERCGAGVGPCPEG